MRRMAAVAITRNSPNSIKFPIRHGAAMIDDVMQSRVRPARPCLLGPTNTNENND